MALSVIPGVLICAVLAAKQLKMIVFFPFHHLQSALKIQKKPLASASLVGIVPRGAWQPSGYF